MTERRDELEGTWVSHYPHGERPSVDAFESALHDVVEALEGKSLPYLFMGGVGTAAMARPRSTDDIDLFVTPDAAPLVLETLEAAGFDTEIADSGWLYKAYRHGVLVDIIFRSVGDVYVDDEMLRRARSRDFRGTRIPVIAPEDLLVIKAVAASEHVSRHWYDAVAIVATCRIDWDYLVERARVSGPRRVLSLLIFAESNDHAVPSHAIRALADFIYLPPGGAS